MGLEYFARRSPEDHAAEAVRQAVAMLGAREAPAGPMPVVLAPGDSGILIHDAVGHGLEADFNWTQSSRYAGKTGQLVASPLCTIVDDATLPGSRGSINVDDEGHDGRRNVLIEGGRPGLLTWAAAGGTGVLNLLGLILAFASGSRLRPKY